MTSFLSRLALFVSLLAAFGVARADDLPVEFKFGVHQLFPVSFTVDGRYSCSSHGEHSEYVCLFADACKGSTADACVEVQLGPGSHTVTVTWNGQSATWQVKLQHIDADPDPDLGGPEEYFNDCQFKLPEGGPPSLDCNIK